MTDRKVRQVSFNLNDEGEREMNEYVAKFTFSTYVKRLIFREMRTQKILADGGSDEGTDSI